MINKTTPDFWNCQKALPENIKRLADKNFALFKTDSSHPSLHFKKVKGYDDLWSVRIGRKYRALANEDGEDLLWFWIGHHSEYDRLISQ